MNKYQKAIYRRSLSVDRDTMIKVISAQQAKKLSQKAGISYQVAFRHLESTLQGWHLDDLRVTYRSAMLDALHKKDNLHGVIAGIVGALIGITFYLTFA
ncbi:hypothetical protein IT774_07485 [Salinimonas marina]|uniref:Uncharacterized protein n=1 Tax=Salinimonas marina TaxID=2785918 RepID=A0A7S9HE48_9ALTE|nr:hypothetical protein [Salinimonas marina]QPG06936.1 hypothetical protein IT774_07485 [Salinimonas marina]